MTEPDDLFDVDGVLSVSQRPIGTAAPEEFDPLPPDIRELSSFQRDVLFVVAGADTPSGQDVKRELQATVRERVLPGQLYSNLAELTERGLLEKRAQDGRTSAYSVTDRGTVVLGELCRWQRDHLPANADPAADVDLPSV